MLDSLKAAHNIGTILRTADAVLAAKVFICGDTIIPPNAKIRNGSIGAEKWVAWEYSADTASVLRRLKADGVYIVAAELSEGSVPYNSIAVDKPVCIVLGREYDGVSPAALSLCDSIVHIPMYGMSNSLNVSVAAGVLIYHFLQNCRLGHD